MRDEDIRRIVADILAIVGICGHCDPQKESEVRLSVEEAFHAGADSASYDVAFDEGWKKGHERGYNEGFNHGRARR